MALADNQALYDKLMDYYYPHTFDYVPGLADNNNVELAVTFFGNYGDGSPVELEPLYGKDVVMGSLEFSESVNPPGEFQLGSVATKRMTFELDNFDGRFDGYEFVGFGVSVALNYKVNGRWEVLRFLSGTVDKVTETYSKIIEISATDKLSKLDKPVDLAELRKQTTVGEFVDALVVNEVGDPDPISFYKQDVPFADEAIATFPKDIGEDTTNKEALQWLAQAGGCFVMEPDHPSIALKWYDKDAFSPDRKESGGYSVTQTREEWLDGGFLSTEAGASSYAGGDSMEGGAFDWRTTLAYNSERYDSLYFTSYNYHVANALTRSSVSKEGIEVTGVTFFVEDQPDSAGNRNHRFFTQGVSMGVGGGNRFDPRHYYLRAKGNAFLNTTPVPNWIYSRLSGVLGTTFVPFSVTCLADPRVRLGDPVVVVGDLGRVFKSYVTGYKYSTSGFMSVSCESESRMENFLDTRNEVNEWASA